MDTNTAKKHALKLIEQASSLSDSAVMDLLNRTVAHNYKVISDDPVVRAEGVWLYTRRGRKLFDGVAAYSAANFGHGHPLMKEAIRLFLESGAPEVLGRFLPDPWLALLGERITNLTGFENFLPVNGGVEAPETAVKLARRWAWQVKKVHQPEIIFAGHCWHGRTITMTQMFDEDDNAGRDGFGPFPPGFVRVPFNDLAAIAKAITPKTAAIMLEPVQGEGGINIPDQGYLAAVAQIARENKLLTIWDEIQTGWARTGKLFCWMHEGDAAKPDIVCVGKSLSGGFGPVAGILARREIMSLFGPGSHGSTFGGSPFSSMLGVAALAVYEHEEIGKRATETGNWLRPRLEAIAKKAASIKEVRSRGMMFGIEFKRTGKDATTYAKKLLELGVVAKDTHGWVLRFTPPLTATHEELEYALEIMEKAFVA
ncbi:MAG: aminotransferase class III-fold pyridoxal phosphate-dependent enzyme [Planctomycetes bacterium]|nr:aminotransferase class III-fold pyridoxal phosphate-dependent enzyme [Planctomycetota bacterium]